jgi:23S rRNA pseudouridine1911/1915/1917 synthase
MYGADPKLAKSLGITRQWLHAKELGFTHPISGEELNLISEYPADLAVVLERLRS